MPVGGEVRHHVRAAATGHELANPLGVMNGDPLGQGAAEAKAQHVGTRNAEVVPERQQVGDQRIRRVGRRCRFGTALIDIGSGRAYFAATFQRIVGLGSGVRSCGTGRRIAGLSTVGPRTVGDETPWTILIRTGGRT